jgi:tetratricopeptide (TPR) repeat protein
LNDDALHFYVQHPTRVMRCKACSRTIVPSRAKTFSGLDFCKRCYDALELRNLERRKLEGYLLSLSEESNKKDFEVLLTIASKFETKERERLLCKCVEVLGDFNTTPHDIFPFLIAAEALRESEGSEPLTKVGELALLNIAKRLTSSLTKMEGSLLDDEIPDDEAFEVVFDQFKSGYTACIEIIDQLPPSECTEIIRENLTELLDACDSLVVTEEVDLSSFEEGIYLQCSETLTDVLLDELGKEHLFCGWSELRDIFKNLDDYFADAKINLVVPDTVDHDSEIWLLVSTGEVYITTQWEKIREACQVKDTREFHVMQKEVPRFVLENAAGDLESLQLLVEKTVSENPEDTDLMLFYLSLLEDLDKIEESVRFMEKKCSEMPKNSKLVSELARVLSESEQTEKAIAWFEKAAEMEPENWTIPVSIGEAYEDMGEFRKAREFYEKALEICPRNPFVIAFAKKSEKAAAISAIEELIQEEAYKEALKMVDEYFDPIDITLFHYYRGVILSRMGEHKKALELMKDYLDIYPEDEEGWLEKASIYLDMGHFAAAARCFRRCSVIDPSSINPLVWEALCHKQLGRSRNYKRCINRARKIDPEGTKALLKSLQF